MGNGGEQGKEKGKTNRGQGGRLKQPGKCFLSVPVPFPLKEEMLNMGIELIPLPDRTGQKVWYAKNEETKKEAEREIERFNQDMESLIQKERKEEEEIANEPEKNKKRREASLVPRIETHGEFNWTAELYQHPWDSLRIVMRIKEYGLPKSVDDRVYILENLRRTESEKGRKYNAVYEDVCEYCEAFQIAYGADFLDNALVTAKIKNSFNLFVKLSKTKLSREIKAAIRYRFPAVRREGIVLDIDENDQMIFPAQ